jgi:hypothetical protein
MPTTTRRTLMGTDNILDLQDNGYKSTVSAISEIIDNSIQAKARNIKIILVRNTTRASDEIDEVLICDDGIGMDESTFNKALQMSAGGRSGARSGLGKYGQGLPNSSISQTKRVEVYTWQESNILYNHIDLDEIFNSGEAFLPEIEIKSNVNIPLKNSGHLPLSSTGTIVRWVKPNRIRPKTVRTLVSHIDQLIGRTFRYFLVGFTDKDGYQYKSKISVLVFDYNGHSFSRNDFSSIDEIVPFDPMFLMERTQMNNLFPESQHPTSQVFNEEIIKNFKVEYNGALLETTVEIKISYCKREERERYGRNAGGEPFGKKYLYRNLIGTSGYHNISVIRAGREIDHGSFGFIRDVSDNRERWWSAEIFVEPVIDAQIGVDNKKQQASKIQFLDPSDGDYNDNDEIIRWISTFLSENIRNVKNLINAQNAGASRSNRTNSGNTLVRLLPGSETEVADPVPLTEGIEAIELTEAKKEFIEWIKVRYPNLIDAEINEIVDYALSMRDNHIFIKSDLGDTQLYSYKVFGTKVLIEINQNHSFYIRFMQTFEDDDNLQISLRSIRLIISSLVNAEIVNSTNDRSLINDRRRLRNRMSESLDDYIEALYSQL